MGSLIFPQTIGLKIDRTKSPEWKTITHIATSGKETRTSTMSYPLWKFSLNYEFLQQDTLKNELKDFMSFYNNLKGGFDTFLYKDPYDNTVTTQNFGTGNGVAVAFQLIRNLSSWVEPITDTETQNIYLNGVLTTAYTILNGIVTFNTAPSNGVAITWSGTFYFRCRMSEDTMDFTQFMYQFWELKKINFISVK